jgi:pyruvate dehydrogenase E1 component beta subunit
VPIGKAIIRKSGKDVTVATVSYMALEAIKAARTLEKSGVSVEVIDLRSVKPLDKDLLLKSVAKTGRLVIADGGWKTCGMAAEISALVCEHGFGFLKAPIKRVTLPDSPAPASGALEKHYYPGNDMIIQAVKEIVPCSRR